MPVSGIGGVYRRLDGTEDGAGAGIAAQPAGPEPTAGEGGVDRAADQGAGAGGGEVLVDIPQMTSKFGTIVPPFHRQGNCIPSAAIRWPDFGDRHSFGRPFAQIFRHSDTPLLSF